MWACERSPSIILTQPYVLFSDKQVIQYTSCPLLALLDGCTPTPEVDLGIGFTTGSSNIHIQPSCTSRDRGESDSPLEMLETSMEPKHSARCSLIRLEPLTEAEASEETLFYLCELSPAGMAADSTELDSLSRN